MCTPSDQKYVCYVTPPASTPWVMARIMHVRMGLHQSSIRHKEANEGTTSKGVRGTDWGRRNGFGVPNRKENPWHQQLAFRTRRIW
jgi:hypothetical protein